MAFRNCLLTILMFLGISGIMQAQAPTVVLITDQTNVALSDQQTAQTVHITSTPSNVTFTYQSASTPTAWLSVIPISTTTPGSLIIGASIGGLPPGSYGGTVTLNAPNAAPLMIPVSLTIAGAGGQITITPGSLTFGSSFGGSNPLPQTLSLTGGSGSTTFNATTSTIVGGGNWLSVGPSSGTIPVAGAGVTPATVSVSVNAAGLTAGTYNGSVLFTFSAGNSQTIPVTLTVSGIAGLVIPPTSLTFSFEVSGPQPPAQMFSVTSNGGVLSFTTSASSTPPGWLTVSQSNPMTASQITAAVSPSGLAPGTYSGKITISAPGTSTPFTEIPVTLQVATSPFLELTPNLVMFSAQSGGLAPQNQLVQVTTSGTPLNVTVALQGGGTWLHVSPTFGVASATQPLTLTLSATPGQLPPADYLDGVIVSAVGANNNPQTVTAKLTVLGNVALNASPSLLNFGFQTGAAPPPTQTVQITSTGGALTFNTSIQTTNCGTGWITVTPTSGTTPTALTIGIVSAGLATGSCLGTVTVTSPGALNPVTISVAANVNGSGSFTVAPAALTFAAVVGGANPPSQKLTVSSATADVVQYSVFPLVTSGPGQLISIDAGFGSTPGTITVTANTQGVAAGTYDGTITVSGVLVNGSQIIPVHVVIGNPVNITVSPSSLTFNQSQGSPKVAPQVLNVSIPGGTGSFSVSVGVTGAVGWLSATPITGIAPSTISIAVDASQLSAGQYKGLVTISSIGATNSPVTVPVTFNVLDPQKFTASPVSLNFTYQTGSGTLPPTQNISVTANGPAAPFTATISATAGLNFLTVSPLSGTTPGTITATVNPLGLSIGTYNATITLTSPNIGTSLTVPVTLTVNPPPGPTPTAITNSASGAVTAIAPGELISIFGTLIGPATPASFIVNAQGGVDSRLSNTRVLFDGTPGTVLYTSQGQVNAIVPYEVATRTTTNVVVEYNGVTSPSITVSVNQTAPGIFTLNSSGKGQGAILNQNSTVNGSGNPAAKGSVVVIYATGEGQTTPLGVTGTITGATLKLPLNAVSLFIDGQNAEILYAGSAPGLVSGVLQINARVPANAASGTVTVQINQGGQISPAVTMAVQ